MEVQSFSWMHSRRRQSAQVGSVGLEKNRRHQFVFISIDLRVAIV